LGSIPEALAGIASSGCVLVAVEGLALAVLGARGGWLNHYYERDLDRLMKRTRSRPLQVEHSGRARGGLGFLALPVRCAAAVTGGTSPLLFLGAFT
jgi:heme O synthase-like polyprenyltransferase